MRKKLKKSIVLPVALLVYTTAMAVLFIPRNQELSDAEKWGTVIISYLIIALLWWVLDKKEKLAIKRQEEMKQNEKEHKF